MKKEDPTFDPSCCTYKLGNKIRRHVEKILKDEDVEKETKTIIEDLMDLEEANKNTLKYDSLVKLHKYVQRADPDYCDPFYMFSENCKCIPPKPRENSQLEERLKKLRLKSSQNMYNTMTSSVDRIVARKIDNQTDSVGGHNEEIKVFSGSTMAVINSFLVYICTFIFCYKAVEYSLSEPNIIAQVLFGLLGSTVVACAELYFLARVI